jgi:glutamine phosphoribosylpyrophosphate amidotransferase
MKIILAKIKHNTFSSHQFAVDTLVYVNLDNIYNGITFNNEKLYLASTTRDYCTNTIYHGRLNATWWVNDKEFVPIINNKSLFKK